MIYEKVLMDSSAIERTVARLAHQIIECNEDLNNVCLIGVLRRGVSLANMLADKIELFSGKRPLTGKLDISLHRDDLEHQNVNINENGTEIPFNIVGKTVVLTDDVIFTGRTTRAAMDAIIKLGRPAKIQLAVLIDRGHRELPIRGDYVGKNIPTSIDERILVKLPDYDETTEVTLKSEK